MIEFLFLAEAVTKPIEVTPEARTEMCRAQNSAQRAPHPVYGNSVEADLQAQAISRTLAASAKKIREEELAANKAAGKEDPRAAEAAKSPPRCAAKAPPAEAKAEPSV